MPVEADLTPLAAERVCREAAQKSFDEAARSLEIDWKVGWDGKQIQRWAEAFGDRMVRERDAEVLRYQQGQRPVCPGPNEPALLVIGVDGDAIRAGRRTRRRTAAGERTRCAP